MILEARKKVITDLVNDHSLSNIEAKLNRVFIAVIRDVIVPEMETGELSVKDAQTLVNKMAKWVSDEPSECLSEILNVPKTFSGCGVTANYDEAVAVVKYCLTHDIPIDAEIGKDRKIQKVTFKDITEEQRDEIMKASTIMQIYGQSLYPD